MDKQLGFDTIKEVWTSGFEAATRQQQAIREAWEAQFAAAQKSSVDAVNRSFELVREATRLAEEQTKAVAEQVKKAWSCVPGSQA